MNSWLDGVSPSNTAARLSVRSLALAATLIVPMLLGAGPGWAADVTNAVDRGLNWLAARQGANGTWSPDVAINSLALLAFLSAGQTPDSQPYGPRVERGVQAVLAQQGADGSFTSGGAMMYGHGVTALLLAQSVGMTGQDSRVRAALGKAVDLILRSQAVPKADLHAGGWRYNLNSTDSDLSVTYWQTIALKAAADVGLKIPQPAMDQALAYIRRCEHVQGGFGYQPGGIPNQGRTAAAMVVLRLCGPADDPAAARARQWLVDQPLRWPDQFYYYATHHCAHAGVGWNRAELLDRQRPDGSWTAVKDSPEDRKGGPAYCTALAILALTAERNYLPVYLP